MSEFLVSDMERWNEFRRKRGRWRWRSEGWRSFGLL